MNNKITRVLVAGDTHCGSLVGLTPPSWRHVTQDMDSARASKSTYAKFSVIQDALWRKADSILQSFAPYNVILWTGDMIDGDGRKSGGTELIVTDRLEQAKMATAVCNHFISRAKCEDVLQFGVYGTGYHTGNAEDMEMIVAENSGWKKISSHEWIDVNGCVFDLKHKVGSSSSPSSRASGLLNQVLWNELWAARDLQPKAKVILRGHAHYYMGVDTDTCAAFVCPALQGFGTKYGSRTCSGLVHFGMMYFDVDEKGNVVDWGKSIECIDLQVAKTTTVRM